LWALILIEMTGHQFRLRRVPWLIQEVVCFAGQKTTRSAFFPLPSIFSARSTDITNLDLAVQIRWSCEWGEPETDDLSGGRSKDMI